MLLKGCSRSQLLGEQRSGGGGGSDRNRSRISRGRVSRIRGRVGIIKMPQGIGGASSHGSM